MAPQQACGRAGAGAGAALAAVQKFAATVAALRRLPETAAVAAKRCGALWHV